MLANKQGDYGKLLGALVVAVLLVGNCYGCATMIRGTSESLMITSEPDGAKVTLSDGRSGTTPCQFECKRDQTVSIKYSKDGYQADSVTVCPALAGAGVVLGGVIDYGTGAVYSLKPNPVHVLLNPNQSQSETKTEGDSTPTTPPAAMAEDETKCPFCAEIIKKEAIVCKHCGRDLPTKPLGQPASEDLTSHGQDQNPPKESGN